MQKNKEEYGTFQCEICLDEGKVVIFHEHKKLMQHIGGAHRRGVSQREAILKCKFCPTKLVIPKTWTESLKKQGNHICIKCKRKQNRQSYRKRIRRKRK